MLVSLLISLAIATLAICVSFNARDEIVQIGAAIVAILCLFLSLIFAPTLIKFLIVVALLLSGKPTINTQGNNEIGLNSKSVY
ncbi:hypothetical protein H6F98_19135 [Microcoleus sp. FACHB-SPT15]|uniref:hypothetical protein n=1 Tax=Microcoleus sp. FACHB-SPT15 TaxID=2692830 RepID=UPI00177CF28E|nr:hypothetical protein [Microcoleus sp. FACHB-SPT15]MBD1807542.1 hypothetical protein [Microcoleus sp. FACHB-SPT15]